MATNYKATFNKSTKQWNYFPLPTPTSIKLKIQMSSVYGKIGTEVKTLPKGKFEMEDERIPMDFLDEISDDNF